MKVLFLLILLTTNAHAYHPKQIENYVKHVYKEKNSCMRRSILAKEIAEKDGYVCEYGVDDKGDRVYHSYLIMEKDGKKYEILR